MCDDILSPSGQPSKPLEVLRLHSESNVLPGADGKQDGLLRREV